MQIKMLPGAGAMIFYLTVVLTLYGQALASRHKLSCMDHEGNATQAIQHFACTTNESYSLTITSPKPGIYIDMKVTMFRGDSFVLSTGSGNDTRTVVALADEQKAYPVMYFIPDNIVTILANVTEGSKGDRSFSGFFQEGCNANLTTTTTPVYHFPPYSNGSGIFTCYITIRASSSKEMDVYASLDSLALKGKSNLSITGQPSNFPAVFKAGEVPEFDFVASSLTLALALDVSIADQSGTMLIDSVYKNCSGMIEITSDSSMALVLPPNMTDHFQQRLSCRWVVRGQDNNILGLEVVGFSLAGAEDILVVTDGGKRNSPVVLQASQGDARVTGLVSRTSSRYMWLSLTVAEYNTSDSFVARVTETAEGGRWENDATDIRISDKSKDSVYLLEVALGMQVLLSPHNISLKGSASVEVVSDFYQNGPVLQKFSAGAEPYAVASLNNRLMLRAQGFMPGDSFVFSFTGVDLGCHSTTLGTSGLYSLSGNCNAVCTWAINPSNSSDKTQKFTLTLDHLNLDNNDNVTIRSLAHPTKPLLVLNASYSSVKPVEMSSVNGAYVVITRNKCAQENGTVASGSVSAVLGSEFAPKLAPGVSYAFQSPHFPNQYPLNSTRSWIFEGTGIGGFHLTFMSMDIARGHALNLMSGNQSVPLNGSTLPADILLEEPKMHAQFTAPIHPGYLSGYGFNALLTPLDSAQVVNKETGQVETPSFPALINESKTFVWSICVPNFEAKMSVAILFNVSHMHKSSKSSGTLTVYDGNSVRSPVLGNLTGENLLTRTDTILVKFVTVAGDGSALQLNFTTYRCNMSDTCNNSKICIHEDWRCNGINDCGDNTDEVGCTYHPTPSPSPTTPSPPGPQPSPSKGGVSTAAFIVTVLLALVIGAAGALFVPVLVRRYRAYRYSRFSNVAVSE